MSVPNVCCKSFIWCLLFFCSSACRQAGLQKLGRLIVFCLDLKSNLPPP